MIRKEIVNPGRLRRMPEGFGWVDHRLVRQGHLKGKSREALALYLFLVTVADADGVSYYSEEKLCGQLNFTPVELNSSRGELVKAGFVAYRRPFYQVLDLPVFYTEKTNADRILSEVCGKDETGCMSLGEIMKSMTGGGEND